MSLRSLFLLVSIAFLFASSAAVSQTKKPIILFILVDDLGWADLGCYGNRFNETPNINRLAKQGVRFTDFYAAGAVCSPTRASIMSGQYQARFGLTDFISGHWRPFEKLAVPHVALELPRNIVTIAEALRGAGYTTAHFGKWHLGGQGHMPPDQGFDKSVVTGGGHGTTFRTRPKVRVPKGRRLAEFLTDQTIEFMKTNRKKPFFVHLSHYAVHIPLQTSAQLEQKYAGKDKVKGYPCNPRYAGLLEEVDQSVGRLMAALKELELDDNTLVVFTSDNGGLIERYNGGEIVSSQAPLRGEKGTLYEGGVRVPLIMRWKGKDKPGETCSVPTISVDFYPTFLQVAGAKPPKRQVVDGVSLLPLLRDPSAKLDRQAIYWHYPHYHHSRPACAIRTGDWKAIEFFDTGKVELYNLKQDIGESKDLSAKMPQKARQLQKMMQQWRSEVDAQMPHRNPAYNPKRAHEWWSRRSLTRVPSRKSESGKRK